MSGLSSKMLEIFSDIFRRETQQQGFQIQEWCKYRWQCCKKMEDERFDFQNVANTWNVLRRPLKYYAKCETRTQQPKRKTRKHEQKPTTSYYYNKNNKSRKNLRMERKEMTRKTGRTGRRTRRRIRIRRKRSRSRSRRRGRTKKHVVSALLWGGAAPPYAWGARCEVWGEHLILTSCP